MTPLIRHVLPEPTGPQTARTSPFLTEKSKPDTVKDVPEVVPSSIIEASDMLDPTRKEAETSARGWLVFRSFSEAHSGKFWSSKGSLRVSRYKNAVRRLTADKACAAPTNWFEKRC